MAKHWDSFLSYCNENKEYEPRLGTLTRHTLKKKHPLHETHELVRHTDEENGNNHSRLIPRVVGCSIPLLTPMSNGCFLLLRTLSHLIVIIL